MAKLNLFGTVAAMEAEDIGTSSSVANGDVAQNEVENIEAQNEVEEVAKLSSEIEQVASQIEEGIDEGEKLDEAIVEGEEVLENNEGGDVPEEAVEVAQEALNESIILLAGREAKKQFKPSLESYETNIQKLRVSLEAAKDFANNIWQKIKELFAKFVVMIKKIIMKISGMFDKGVKQADALKKIFEKRTELDNGKMTEEFKDRLAKAYPVMFKYPGISLLIGKDDGKIAKVGGVISGIVNFTKNILFGKPTTEQAATSLLNNYGITADLKDDPDDGREELAYVLPKRFGVWYIGTQGSTGFEKIDINGSDIDDSVIKNLTSEKLINAAEDVKSKAKTFKTIIKNADNEISKASKEIDKARDAELKGALSYEEKALARKRANIAYKVSTQMAFQGVTQAQDVIAGKLAVLSILSTAFKAPSGSTSK